MSTTYDARELGQTAVSNGVVSRCIRQCWQEIQRWRERQRVRASLYDLSDLELRDIGITRGEIEYFARAAISVDPRN